MIELLVVLALFPLVPIGIVIGFCILIGGMIAGGKR